MATTFKEIKDEIVKLTKEGVELGQEESLKDNKKKKKEVIPDEKPISVSYQRWYTKTLPIIKQLLPDRYQEFVELYLIEKRKELDNVNYTIRDYLHDVVFPWDVSGKEFDYHGIFATKFLTQIVILQSCLDRLNSNLANIRGTLQADLFDDELSTAEDLFKKGHLRAAGALSGVTLERHLASVAENHEIKISKKNPTIADLNEALKTAEVYDVPDWRFIQRLGDIRNLAVHNKDREPTKDEIDDLIRGTQKVIKTIF